MGGAGYGWGWSYWGTNWRGNTIVPYNRNGLRCSEIATGVVAITVAAIVLDTLRIVLALPGIVRVNSGHGRPPGYRPPATTLPSPGNRPPATTLLAGAGNRPNVPGGDTQAGRRDADYSAGYPRESSECPRIALQVRGQALARQRLRGIVRTRTRVHDPARMKLRGYQRPQTSNTWPRKLLVRMHFQDLWGECAQSARGNQSVAAKGGRGRSLVVRTTMEPETTLARRKFYLVR